MENVLITRLLLQAPGADLTGDLWDALQNSCQTCLTEGEDVGSLSTNSHPSLIEGFQLLVFGLAL